MPNNPLPPPQPPKLPEVKIVIHINPATGNIDRLEGPLHMKQFVVETLATAIHMALNWQPPAPTPQILVPTNGNVKATH
jgi:hypothetical protein